MQSKIFIKRINSPGKAYLLFFSSKKSNILLSMGLLPVILQYWKKSFIASIFVLIFTYLDKSFVSKILKCSNLE